MSAQPADPVVVLARHGRTAWHSPNRYTGRSDIPLDDTGLRQAGALARWAAGQGFIAVACSDLRRAVDTARLAADAAGLEVRVDPRLRELDFGMAEGRTLDELRASDPDAARRFVEDPVAHPFPGGEDPEAAVIRFRAGLDDVAAGRGRVLVVAHSTVIRLAVCAVLGLPLRDYRRRLPALAPAAVTTLRLGSPGALLAYNVPVSE